MKRVVTNDEAGAFGVTTHHERMANGEFRFRLMSRDGSAYIRTESDSTGGWQNSHFHNHVMETYIVQQGWMAFAELADNKLMIRIIRPGGIVTSQPGRSHNVYLPAHAVIHTVKHGQAEGTDWIAAPDLDAMTKPLTEPEILRLGSE